MAIIGIDLGTTNSLAAVWRDGESRLIPNALGEYLTPSVVSIDSDGTVLVGQAAKERLISDPERTVAGFKRAMGGKQKFWLGGQHFLPEELSSFILRRLAEDAEAYLGEPVTEAVVSVPAYFAEAQRAATKRAAALAGIKVERLVNEPSAAALSGAIGNDDEDDKVCLVFDLGGGTLDVSLVEKFENVVSVTAVSGINRLGGRDFDAAIVKGFCSDCGIDMEKLNTRQIELLLRQAEQCKIALSSTDPVVLAVDDGKLRASLPLTNEWMIQKCAELFRQMTEPIHRVFLDAGISTDELDDLVMVGGSSYMPSVRRYISKFVKREPFHGANPDTAVALGAGICAGMKSHARDLGDLVLTDVCPFTLGVGVVNWNETARSLMSPVIERNSVLPTSKMGAYCTAFDNQQKVIFRVYQGEELYCEDNTLLGEVALDVPPAPAGQQTADIRFTYDINGLLEVEAVSKQGKLARLLLKSGDMSAAEVSRRLEELRTLKIHPREQEACRVLIERAKRMYAMTVGGLREYIGSALDWYQSQLNSQEPLQIAKAGKRMNEILDRAEAWTGDVSFDEEWPEGDDEI